MKSEILYPRIQAALREVEEQGYLSYKTRYRLFLSEGIRIHNYFRVFTELISAKACLDQTPQLFTVEIHEKLENHLANAFKLLETPKNAQGGQNLDLAELRSFCFDDHPEVGSPFFISSLQHNPRAQDLIDREMCKAYAVYSACHKVGWANELWLGYPEELNMADEHDAETAEAADWFLAYKSGSFTVEDNNANIVFWKYYLETIMPDAAELEEKLGPRAYYHNLSDIEAELKARYTFPKFENPPPRTALLSLIRRFPLLSSPLFGGAAHGRLAKLSINRHPRKVRNRQVLDMIIAGFIRFLSSPKW